MRRPSLLAFLCSLLNIVYSKDLGVFGHTFPIAEQNLIEVLSARARCSNSEELSSIFLQSTKKPIQGVSISLAEASRVYTYDPTYVLERDIEDDMGKVLFKKGTKINPLETTTLREGLLFFDATSMDQIQWAVSQKGQFKWVIVNGDPFTAESEHKRPVYFDQGGVLAFKLGLKAIPARVTQNGRALLIEEIALKGRGGV